MMLSVYGICILVTIICKQIINVLSEFTCPPRCTTSVCTSEENPNCLGEPEEWGCETCIGDLWYNDWGSPCVTCQEVYGDTCESCINWSGCQTCAEGFDRIWNQACGLYYCIGGMFNYLINFVIYS